MIRFPCCELKEHLWDEIPMLALKVGSRTGKLNVLDKHLVQKNIEISLQAPQHSQIIWLLPRRDKSLPDPGACTSWRSLQGASEAHQV